MPDASRRRLVAWLLAFPMVLLALGSPPARTGVTETFSRATPGSGLTVDHGAWSALLREYVVVGSDGINRVDYVAFKSNGRERLKSYIRGLEAVEVAALDKAEQAAFWINLYNAKTADIVLDRYPVKSIREISLPDAKGVSSDGPWKANVATVGGVGLSLDEIENEIMRPVFKDPRVHYALNCLSIGCPNLLNEAYTGAKLEAQLEGAAKSFVNDPRGISVEGDKVRACSIYEWFVSDFGGTIEGVLAHIRKYADPPLLAKLSNVRQINEYHYDWTLNDAQR